LSFHLDSNIVIGILNGRPQDCRDRYEQVRASGEGVFVSSIVVFELRYGIALSKRIEQNARVLRLFLGTLDDVLPFTNNDASAAGELRATLKSAGTPIGPYDVLIAAQAIRAGATLVTANASEFRRVSGLKWQDWTK